jgi:chromosome segregation ATPase
MNTLLERLVSWAQNEEMINQHFTDHGKDCNEAVKEIERFEAAVDKLVCLLAERDIEIGRLTADNENFRNTITSCQISLNENLRNTITACQISLKKRDAETERLTAELAIANRDVAMRVDVADDLQARVEALEAKLYRKDERIKAWKQSSDENEARVEALEVLADALAATEQESDDE